jgi:hypothetical protein
MKKRIILFSLFLISAHFLYAQPEYPVPVKIAVFIVDVRDIDGARQNFSADVLVRLRWKDQSLATGKRQFLSLTQAWHPNIQIVNRIAVQSTLPEGIEVDGQGNAIYRQRLIGQFTCSMNLREFPFDQQEFPIRLVAIGFSPQQIQFISDPDPVIVGKLSITDWKVFSSKKDPEIYQVPGSVQLAGFKATFVAKRYVLFFLVQIIVPIALILGMSWIAFWLDFKQVGPRISISITSMLTIVAYRLLIANFIPRLPYLTRMDYFVFSSTALVFLTLVTVVVISRYVLGENDDTAKTIDKNCRWIFPTMFVIVLIGCFFV